MSGWRDMTLGEFVALQRGHDLTEPQRRIGHVPVMGSAGQNGFHDTALAKGPGIVIGRSGASFGQVHFSKEDFWPHNTGLYVTDFKGNDPLFAFYFLKALDFDRFNSGSAQPSPNRNFIYPIPIRVPKPAEQKAIAAVLGALDDKIELNRRMNATLEAMARALFQSWFVDFDPVRANMDRSATGQPSPPAPLPLGEGGRRPGEGAAGLGRGSKDREKAKLPSPLGRRAGDEGAFGILDGRPPAALDPATAALFPASFDDSALGHIPKGWEVKTIEELAERVAMGPFGSDIKVSTFVPEGIPVVSGQHLRGTLLDDSEFNFVSVEHANRLRRSNVQRGDVIFTHAGSIGQVAYIPEASRYERYIVSRRQFYMRCNRALVSPFYITSYFKTPEGQHRLLANTSSTGVPSISQPVTYLRQLKMIVPPPALLKVFDTTVSEIHLKITANLQQSRTLATLRDTLLPKLLSGELSVAETTSRIGEAL